MRTWVVVAAVVIAGCREQRLQSVSGALRLEPGSLDCGEVPVLNSAQRSLNVTNTGTVALTVTFRSEGPFAAPMELGLPGGATETIAIAFAPQALGPVSGRLIASAGDASAVVALQGVGIAAPPCVAGACARASLDAVTGLCVISPEPDGTACDDRCVTGTCRGGVCAGTARDCGDQDGCTTDGCAPGFGCVHAPVMCVETNPCQVGRCGPSGCTSAPVDDGTACGPADCATAQVCIGGACVARAVPDGARCGTETACQAKGTCTDGTCVVPPPSALALAFRRTPGPGKFFAGLVADDGGNYFTVECPAGIVDAPCELLSFTAAGADRWRAPFGFRDPSALSRCAAPLMRAGETIVSTRSANGAAAFDAVTGTRLWELPPPIGLIEDRLCAAWNGGDDLFLTGEVLGSRFIASVHPRSGLVRHYGTAFEQSIATGQRAEEVVTRLLFDGIHPLPSIEAITGLDIPGMGSAQLPPDGGSATHFQWLLRWERSQPVLAGGQARRMMAVRDDRALLGHVTGLSMVSLPGGAPITIPLPQTTGTPRAVWGSPTLYLLAQECTGSCYLPELVVVNPVAKQTRKAQLPGADWVMPPWLSSSDEAVLAVKPFGRRAQLREIDALGRTQMECTFDLPAQRTPASLPVVTTGQYAMLTREGTITALEAWTVPGLAPATRGWVSPLGGPGFDGREQ